MTEFEVETGAVFETTFWKNPIEDSRYRFRATHLNGRKAPKVVLTSDPRVRAGVPCLVRVLRIEKPERTDRGLIEVELVRLLAFEPRGVYLDPIVRDKLQVALESGLNILLDGPQGCGKTVLARAIAEALGMEFVFFNCGAVVEATDFLATIQVRSSESGHPLTGFVKTEVLEALEAAGTHPERSYLVFLDELNRCAEAARNALMPALDATRRVFNPITNTFLPIPDNVQFVAAVNRGSEFTATFGIDAAQLDRFAPLQMEYLPPEAEVDLLAGRHPEVPRELIETVVEVARVIRGSTEISGGLSVRATEEVCVYLKHPVMEHRAAAMLPEILKSSFCGRFSGRWHDASTDAGMVWTLIEGALGSKRGKRKPQTVGE